jgi:hypothetical protein
MRPPNRPRNQSRKKNERSGSSTLGNHIQLPIKWEENFFRNSYFLPQVWHDSGTLSIVNRALNVALRNLHRFSQGFHQSKTYVRSGRARKYSCNSLHVGYYPFQGLIKKESSANILRRRNAGARVPSALHTPPPACPRAPPSSG